jgi:anti-anti-sigma factor
MEAAGGKRNPVDISFDTLPSGACVITLKGRMDVMGAGAIDVRFAAVAAANRAVIVDMSQVEFLASMGLRTLIMGAKGAASKRGKLVIARPSEMVSAVITTSGMTDLLPMVDSIEAGEAIVLA